MKKCNRSSRFRRSRSAISLSIIVALLGTIEIPAAAFGVRTLQPSQTESITASGDISLSSSSATVSENGVELRWRTSYEIDNLGFNVYRSRDGQRRRVNLEIIPGSIFIVGDKTPLRAGYSYSFFDYGGTADSTYYIESVSPVGTVKQFEPLRTVAGGKFFDGSPGATAERTSQFGGSPSISSSQREYPASESIRAVASGSIEDQWAIAAQPGLKIFIKKDGWYRVTQQQMVAAGFNPTVDVRNLLLYVDSQELAIRTSKSRGQFSSGDYFEFYGRALDTPTTDTRTYYLIAGSSAGKRVRGEIQLDTSEEVLPLVPQSTPALGLLTRPTSIWFGLIFGFLNGLDRPVEDSMRTRNRVPALAKSGGKVSYPLKSEARVTDLPNSETKVSDPADSATKATAPPKGEPTVNSQPESQPIVAAVSRKKQSKRKTAKRKKITRREHNHALSIAASPSSFEFTVERKDRIIYFSKVLNGDEENFFGQVLTSAPVTQTLTILNPDVSAPGSAKLEIALQGVSFVTHQVNVFLNDVMVGTMTYFGEERRVQTMDVPVSILRNGDNTLKFVYAVTSATSLVDYARVTYPHAYRADNNSLRFSLRSAQSATINGFSTPNLNVIDYTDPFSVQVIRPITEVSDSGYAFTVSASVVRSKIPRVLYVVPEGQPEQPAGFAFNQPSALNQSSNGVDMLIVAHKSLIQSVAPLADLRRSQGMTVSVVDVEDVYDEFAFGTHGPQAIRDFLVRAKSSWALVPRYVLFAGDASLDPRNYQGAGNLDFVPTKLVDATYNETASDDWLADFDNDGIADIPVGRLPARTPSQANLIVSKIVNFAPANVPQSALLVADTQGNYYFDFEAANDTVQSLVSSSLTPVYRVNRRTEPSDAAARANIIAGFNQGQALVNYTGHGNVNVWTGGPIFTSSDALALTNGDKLPFVVIMDCLNGYFQDPVLEGLAESLLKAPNGGAVASFASSGLTIPDGPHQMSTQLYTLLYGSQSSPPLGDAIKTAKAATTDIDARRTWIFFGDPSMKIR